MEVDLPWGRGFELDEAQEGSACGAYGFEVVRGNQDERYPFKIQNEARSLEAASHSLHFEVHQGAARDFSRDGSPAEGVIEPDHLYLQVAGARRGYAPLSRRLRGMRFYNFAYDTMREAEPSARGAVLGARGQQLASVLGSLGRQAPRHKERLDAYLRAVVPGVVSVDEWVAGPYLTLKLTTSGGVGGRLAEFGPGGMSDGTIRAVGVLAALFQPAVLDGDVPLVGIEEPEIALHPAAAGVLFDALTEASDWVQVLATSQSPDLFDRDDLDVDIDRAVSMQDGLTTIGDIDDASRSIVRDKLFRSAVSMVCPTASPLPTIPRGSATRRAG